MNRLHEEVGAVFNATCFVLDCDSLPTTSVLADIEYLLKQYFYNDTYICTMKVNFFSESIFISYSAHFKYALGAVLLGRKIQIANHTLKRFKLLGWQVLHIISKWLFKGNAAIVKIQHRILIGLTFLLQRSLALYRAKKH